jgi:GNAT superfamily N-acetyltransferase
MDSELLKMRELVPGMPGWDDAVALYRSAFPEVEQFPLEFIVDKVNEGSAGFLGFFEEDEMRGIAIVTVSDDMTYVLYLAVCHDVRSMGYGTGMLERLKGTAPHGRVALDVEPLEDGARNIEQRRRRFAFYRRNGFTRTGFMLLEGDEKYTVLCSGSAISRQQLERTLRPVANPGHMHIVVLDE